MSRIDVGQGSGCFCRRFACRVAKCSGNFERNSRRGSGGMLCRTGTSTEWLHHEFDGRCWKICKVLFHFWKTNKNMINYLFFQKKIKIFWSESKFQVRQSGMHAMARILTQQTALIEASKLTRYVLFCLKKMIEQSAGKIGRTREVINLTTLWNDFFFFKSSRFINQPSFFSSFFQNKKKIIFSVPPNQSSAFSNGTNRISPRSFVTQSN